MGRGCPSHNSNHNAKTTLVNVNRLIRTAIVVTAAFTSSAFAETLIDRVAAIVNGEPVLHSDIVDKVNHGPLVMVSEYPATEAASQFEKALQDAINFQMVLQKAKELEIEVRDDEVEAEIKRTLESRGLDRDGLMKALAGQGQTYEEYKTDFRDFMILRRFQGRVIAPLIKLTDKDVETYYLKKSGSTADLVELTLRQIVIKTTPDASPEIAQAKQNLAREVHAKLVSGLDFRDAVKIYSDEPGARDNGGLTQGVRLKDLAPAIRAEVENLESQAFTSPIQTTAGYYIFFLEERKFSGSRDFLDKKPALEMELRNIELVNQTKRWLTEQRQKSKIDVIPE